MDDFKTPRTGTLDPRLFQRTPSGDHHTAAHSESEDRDSPAPFSDEAHRVDDGHGVDSAAVSASRQSSQRQEPQHQQLQERPPGQEQHHHQQRRTPETTVDDADATPLRDQTADSPSAFSSVNDDAIDSSSDQHHHQLHLDPRDGVRRHQGDTQHFTSDDPMSHERASQPQLRNYREELRAHQRRTHELFSRTVSAESLNASALFRRQVISSTDRLTSSASTTNGLARRSSSQNDRQFLSSGGGAGGDEGPSRPPSSVGVASVSSGPSTTSAAAPIAAGGGAAVFTAMTEQLRSSGSRPHDHTSAGAIRRQSDERAFVRQSSTTTAVAAGAGHAQTTGYEGGLGPRGPSTIVGAHAATPRHNIDIPRRETGTAAVATSSGAHPSEVFMRQAHDARDIHQNVTPSAAPTSSHLRAGTTFTSASAPTGLQPPSTFGPDVFTPSHFESPSGRVRTFTGSSDAASAATVTVRADEFCALQATVAKLHVLVVELMADQAVNNGAVIAQNTAYQTLLDDVRQTSERSAKVEAEAARIAEQSAAETAAVLADFSRPVDFARLLLEARQNANAADENDDAWLSPSKQLAEINAELLARTAPSSSSAKRERAGAVDQQGAPQRSEEAAQHQAQQPQDMSAASHYSDEQGTYFDHANAVDASAIDADSQNRGHEYGVDGHRRGPLFAETAASVRTSTAATIPHEPQRNHRGGVPAASSSSTTRPPVGFSAQQRSTPPGQQLGSSSPRVGSGAIVEGPGAEGDVGGSEQSQVDTMRSAVVQEEITKAYAQVAAVLQENGRLRSERNAAREKLRGAERELRMAETALVGLHHEVDRLGRNIDAQVERKLLKAERSRRHASSASKR